MTQTYRVPGQRTTRRPGAVYAHTTRCVDSAGMPADGVEDGYVGKSRDVERRTAQHAGELPQRTGEVVQQNWWDLRVGDTRILESGLWTDDELDARERYWIAALQPRYNDVANEGRADRIRKFEARRHRDVRDLAAGLTPRQWDAAPVPAGRWWPFARRVLRSRWTWWLAAWAAFTVALAVVDVVGQYLTLRQSAYVTASGMVGGWLWWRFYARRKVNRWVRRIFPRRRSR